MHVVKFEEAIERIVGRDPRYHRDAYQFLREALDHTHKLVGKSKKEEVRHVSGQQLLSGIRDFALQQFGPMSLTVLDEWGIRRCEDFGEIVFNMVEAGLLKKTEQDSREDFKDGYDFQSAFRDPFRPTRRERSTAAEASHS